MKKHVLTPIKLFLENLAHLDDSAETINLKDTNLLELEQANSQFKNLMRQIKKLKIDIYEKELEKQKTMMNYLQLQIRPHFFLNCLNTIYSMAQTQLYEEIMKMSMITSNYFRYIFQNTQDLVPVKNELEHIKNYMEIQKMRYGDTFSYEIHAEEGTENIRIPPILIQTTLAFSQVPAFMLEVADAMGMDKKRKFRQVEVPLAMPGIISGIRMAMSEVIASATLAAYIGAGGLGILIFNGINLLKTEYLVIGGGTVAVITMLCSMGLGAIQKKLSRAA